MPSYRWHALCFMAAATAVFNDTILTIIGDKHSILCKQTTFVLTYGQIFNFESVFNISMKLNKNPKKTWDMDMTRKSLQLIKIKVIAHHRDNTSLCSFLFVQMNNIDILIANSPFIKVPQPIVIRLGDKTIMNSPYMFSLNIINCKFIRGTSITGSVLSINILQRYGAVIRVNFNIIKSVFHGNIANHNGILCVKNQQPDIKANITVYHSIFDNNIVSRKGVFHVNSVLKQGTHNCQIFATIFHCVFSGNIVRAASSVLFVSNTAYLGLNNCKFTKNVILETGKGSLITGVVSFAKAINLEIVVDRLNKAGAVIMEFILSSSDHKHITELSIHCQCPL